MIVDSSAIVAMVNGEPEGRAFTQLLEESDDVRISAATYVECSVVLGPDVRTDFDAWLSAAGAAIVPLDAAQAVVASRAYATYGTGSGSQTRLNLGDCFSYALAKLTGRPLLLKGDDFTHTDVTPAYST